MCADTTPGVHRTDSDEILWWLPVIGPTATVLAQTLGSSTGTTTPARFVWRKTAEQNLDNLAKYLQRLNDSRQ